VGVSPAASGFGSSTSVAFTSSGASPSAGAPSSKRIPPDAVPEVGAGPASGSEREEFITITTTTRATTTAITPTMVHVMVRERRFSAASRLACACPAVSRELTGDLLLTIILYLSESRLSSFERVRFYANKLYVA